MIVHAAMWGYTADHHSTTRAVSAVICTCHTAMFLFVSGPSARHTLIRSCCFTPYCIINIVCTCVIINTLHTDASGFSTRLDDAFYARYPGVRVLLLVGTLK